MTEQHDGSTGREVPLASAPAGVPSSGAPPETGDIVIDAALRDLAAAPDDDLDAQLEAGTRRAGVPLHRVETHADLVPTLVGVVAETRRPVRGGAR